MTDFWCFWCYPACACDSGFIVRIKGPENGFGHVLGIGAIPEAVRRQWGLVEGGVY